VLAEQSQACAERLALTHGRHASDLYDKHLFNTLLDTLIEKGFVRSDENRLTATDAMLHAETDARHMLAEQIRHAILNATLAFQGTALPTE
jgi:glycerol-3-phosphate O-acyltransferase